MCLSSRPGVAQSAAISWRSSIASSILLPARHDKPGDIAEHLPAKISALRAHGTQVKVWVEQWRNGDGVASYALSNGVAHPVVATEHYVLAAGPSEGCEADLFGGLGVSGTEPVGDR